MKNELRNTNELLRVMYDLLPNDAHNSKILFINFYKPYVQHTLGVKNGTFLYVAYDMEDKENVEMNENLYTENVDAVIMGDELEEWMKQKKFDYCIMNPPYNGSLHLHVLEKVMPHVDRKIVNLSPIRWLQDPLAIYKQNNDFEKFADIRKRADIKKIIDTNTASKLFGIQLSFNLGIYDISDTNKGIDTPIISIENNTSAITRVFYKIVNKIVDDNNFVKLDIRKYEDALKNYVCISYYSSESKYGKKRFFWLKDVGRPFTDGYTYRMYKDGNRFATRGDVNNTECIIFSTKAEAENCYNSFKCVIPKFLCMLTTVNLCVHIQFAPFMSDYTKPWTDKRFCEHFGITGYVSETAAEPGSEWEIILNALMDK